MRGKPKELRWELLCAGSVKESWSELLSIAVKVIEVNRKAIALYWPYTRQHFSKHYTENQGRDLHTVRVRCERCKRSYFLNLFHHQWLDKQTCSSGYSMSVESRDIRKKTISWKGDGPQNWQLSVRFQFSFGQLKFGHLRGEEGWGARALLWSLFKILDQSLLLIVVHLKKLCVALLWQPATVSCLDFAAASLDIKQGCEYGDLHVYCSFLLFWYLRKCKYKNVVSVNVALLFYVVKCQ